MRALRLGTGFPPAVADARPLLLLACITMALFWAPPEVAGNGGALVFEDRVGDYAVSVTVNPPEPKPGIVLVGVVIQAVVSTNGDDETTLVPVSTELTLTATGPDPERAVIGPLEARPVLQGISHFDIVLEVPQTGAWTLTLGFTGPLGDVTFDVSMEVADVEEASGADAAASGDPWRSWLPPGLALLVLLAGVGAWALRRRPSTPGE